MARERGERSLPKLIIPAALGFVALASVSYGACSADISTSSTGNGGTISSTPSGGSRPSGSGGSGGVGGETPITPTTSEGGSSTQNVGGFIA